MAETIVQTKGQPDLRMVEIEHPLGGIGVEDLDLRVEAAVRLAIEFVDQAD